MFSEQLAFPVTEHDFKRLFGNSPMSMVITSPHTDTEKPKILYVNKSYEKMTGFSFNELIGKSPTISQGEMSNYQELREMKTKLINGDTFRCETVNYRKDGSPYAANISVMPIINEDLKAVYYVGHLESVQANQSVNILCQQAIRDSRDNIAILDANGKFMFVNEAYTQRYGYTNDEIQGKPSNILKSGKHTQEFYEKLWKRLTIGQSLKELFINKTKEGALIYEEQMISPIKENGNIIGYVTIGRDIKQTIEREHVLKRRANYDQLTDIYNRYGAIQQIELT